jgi:hypothetical protein
VPDLNSLQVDMPLQAPVICQRQPWAGKTPAVGNQSLRGPGRCRLGGQIVQPACMPKERFPRRVFSAEIFAQLGVI